MSVEPKPPKGSPAKVDYHMRQLHKLFARSTHEHFLKMVWAIDALRSGRVEQAARFLTYPQAALNQNMTSRYRIHQWELETLLIQLFLSSAEESGVYLSGTEFNIHSEMRRIAQRQFHWQRGYFNLPQFYRYSFIYAQGKCGEYFEQKYGIPITELNFVGLSFFTQSKLTPSIKRNFSLPELGLTNEIVQKALPLLLISTHRAQEETSTIVNQMNEKHGRLIPTAFLPSIIRRCPLVSLRERRG